MVEMMDVFIDSNILIYASHECEQHETVKQKLESLLKSGRLFCINAIILSEVWFVLGNLHGFQNATVILKNILDSDYIRYLEIRKETVHSALTLAEENNLRPNDAIIVAHTIAESATLLSNDKNDLRGIPNLNLEFV